MFRLIGIVIVLGLVAWLALRQIGDANATLEDGLDGFEAAGVEVERGGRPTDAARAVGKHVEATLATSKSRIDDSRDGEARDSE
jgi:hypothetical protein